MVRIWINYRIMFLDLWLFYASIQMVIGHGSQPGIFYTSRSSMYHCRKTGIESICSPRWSGLPSSDSQSAPARSNFPVHRPKHAIPGQYRRFLSHIP